jgi:hypothetical protein
VGKEAMTTRRNLSGIYFRYENPETSKWENWCFEDLPEKEQDKYLEEHSKEWVMILAKQLAYTLKKIGKEFDIVSY